MLWHEIMTRRGNHELCNIHIFTHLILKIKVWPDKVIYGKPINFEDLFKSDIQGEGPCTWCIKDPPILCDEASGSERDKVKKYQEDIFGTINDVII